MPSSAPLTALVVALLAAGLAASGSAFADVASQALPGMVHPPHVNFHAQRVTPAQAAPLTEAAKQMLAILQRTSPLADPRGMSEHLGITINSPPDGARPGAPAMATAWLLVKPIDRTDAGTVRDAGGRYQGVGEGPSLKFHVNDIGVALSNVPLDFAQEQFFHEPPVRGTLAGFPVYQGPRGDVLLLTHDGRVPWKPYTVERFLRGLLKDEKETHATFTTAAAPSGDNEMRKVYEEWLANHEAELQMMKEIYKTTFTDPAQYAAEVEKYRRTQQAVGAGLKAQAEATPAADPQLARVNQERAQRIAALEAELARLSPSQLAAAACASGKTRRGALHILDYQCGPDATRYVVADQEYFRTDLPLGAVQLIAVTSTYGLLTDVKDRQLHFTARQLRKAGQELDYRALAALVQ